MLRPSLLLSLALFVCAAHAEEPLPEALPPAQEEAALRQAETAGLRMNRHDKAAWVATDELSRLKGFRKDRRVAGWITEERDDQIVVTFIGSDDGAALEALYRTTVSAAGKAVGKPLVLEIPEPLTEFETNAAAARAAAMSSSFAACAQNYNSIVLPGADGPRGKWIVYLLPGTTDGKVVPIGGSYRMEVDGSSHKILSSRGFTHTCIQLADDPRAVALFITHLLDPVPTEIHVFWSLSLGKDMYVGTPPKGTTWLVHGASIKLIKRKS
jgi:hypothetical protein